MRIFAVIITAAFITAGYSYFSPSFAQGAISAEQATDVILEKVFDEAEKTIIEEYYGQMNKKGKDKDHAKKEGKEKHKDKTSLKGKDKGHKKSDDDEDKKWWKRDKTSSKGKDKKSDGNQSKQMPPGLAKKETLPPGLANHLEKHGTLPPGLAKRDLPSDLLSRLPAAKKGTKRAIVGNDIVLLEEGTEIVLDILKGVVDSAN